MKNKIKILICLHLILLLYSGAAICSKFASACDFFSLEFCLWYFFIILILVIYAVGWQQIIKRIPLNIAFANKAVTVVWGIFWGILLFGEYLSLGKCIGAILVIIGVVSYSFFSKDDLIG